jgi:hypothetical protein
VTRQKVVGVFVHFIRHFIRNISLVDNAVTKEYAVEFLLKKCSLILIVFMM